MSVDMSPRMAELDTLIANGQGDRPGVGPIRPPLAVTRKAKLAAYAAQMRAGTTPHTRCPEIPTTWPRGRRIIEAVALRHGLKPEQLQKGAKDGGNFRIIVRARAEAVVQIREQLGYNLPLIGRIFGGFHHTTILHLVEKYGNVEVAAPAPVEEQLQELEARAAELWSGIVELRQRMKDGK
jgi:hypothetical protein